MATTEITTRQIADNAITNAKVAAGASIATSKLADAANFILKNGSVAMTGALNLGSQRITNVSTPSTGTDAANMSYVDTAVAGVSSVSQWKAPCRVATTGNVNVGSFGATIDGVTLADNDRVLLKSQTDPIENGIYIYYSSSPPARTTDADSWVEVVGAMVAVEQGTVNADTLWLCTVNRGGTVGSTAITWASMSPVAGMAEANFVDKEIPSGSINGSNTAYTLANTPVAGSEHVYLNGVLQESGAGNDYTISGTAITMLTAPLTGEKIRVSYRK